MSVDPMALYESLLGAGAILAGFCGTFLAFKIQREAGYFRQPVADFSSGRAKDVHVNLTHFSSSFLLLGLASVAACIFGVVFPLLGLAGVDGVLGWADVAVGGVIGTLVLLAAYFIDELVHYRILSGRLAGDAREWGREWVIVAGGIALAVAAAFLTARQL